MTGMLNAVYWPAIERPKMAELPMGPANPIKPMTRAMDADVQTAVTGVRVLWLTWEMRPEKGMALSRANANICLEAATSYSFAIVNDRHHGDG